MKNIAQAGSSFLHMLGVLLLLGGMGYGVFWFAEQYYHQQYLDQTIKFMSNVFSRFRNVHAEAVSKQLNIDNAVFYKSNGIVDECEVVGSSFDPSKNVCQLPIGEFTADISFSYPYSDTYFYIIFNNRLKRQSCVEFLEKGWEKFIPNDWWGDVGYLGTTSDTGEGKMLFSLNEEFIQKEGASRTPNKKQIKEVCNICRKSSYCGVVFFFRGK